MEDMVKSFCGMCGSSAGCGINCYLEDGKLVKIDGMKEASNKGRLCRRAISAAEWVYSPQRLKYPLKRIGKKGEGKFEKITWDEALDIIADKLKEQKEKYGPESLAILSPQGRDYKDYFIRFLTVHGSPNFCHSGICSVQKAFGLSYTLGSGMSMPDTKNTDLIVIWGAKSIYDTPRLGVGAFREAQKRGARVIIIKPEIEPDEIKPDVWVPVRPGTDGALALAMLHVIINEKLYDKDFVDKWCYGFDELAVHIQKYTPEWGETITGVPATQIRDVAREYATTKAACICSGNAFEQTVDSNNAVRALAILIAICGHFDRPGGNVVPSGSSMPRPKNLQLRNRYSQELIDKLVGPEIAPAFQPFREGISAAYYKCIDSIITEDPYEIKTLIAPGTQPTVITRGSKRVIEALEKVEFFVVIDVMENAAMPWADIVIPVTTPYERDHPFISKGNCIMARNKVIEPLGDYKSDYEFWLDLAVKMGYGDDFWQGSIEDCMNYQLEPFGITYEELKKNPAGIFYEQKPMTYEKYEKIFSASSPRLSKEPYLPQGKVAIYNTLFEESGFNPLPEWVEPPESVTGTPELLAKYPLIFTDTHSSKVYTQSWLRNIPSLRKMDPEPWIHIHPETAQKRGIADGDQVIVESPHGWIKVKAIYSQNIRPDVVMSLHGWWQSCEELGLPSYSLTDGGANVNIMYSVDPEKAYDPLVTAMPRQTLVEVKKAE